MTSLAAIRAWLNDPASGPEVYRRNWNGKCQALMWQVCHRFGTAPVVYEDADHAAIATAIRGTDPKAAPVGAFHFWKLGTYGHVALGLGGERVLMASTHVDDLWATAVGVVDVSTYNARVAGETYIGWGISDGANDLTLDTIATASIGTTAIEEDDMPLTDADVNKIINGLRYTIWETAPLPGKGGPETFEQAIGNTRRALANIETKVSAGLDRQTGYGRRVEIIQETLLPRVLDAIAADEVTLTDEQIATLTGALSSAGIIARLDDATLGQVADAAADEADRRAKARLAS